MALSALRPACRFRACPIDPEEPLDLGACLVIPAASRGVIRGATSAAEAPPGLLQALR